METQKGGLLKTLEGFRGFTQMCLENEDIRVIGGKSSNVVLGGITSVK